MLWFVNTGDGNDVGATLGATLIDIISLSLF